MVGSVEIFLPHPCILNFIDVQFEKACRIFHIPKCMRQIARNLTVKIRAVHPKVGPLALHTTSESFVKTSCQHPFKSLARGTLFLCLWWGSSPDVPVASSSPDHGDVTSQLGKWHFHFISKEGVDSADAVGWGFAGAGSPIMVDSWGEMANRAARDMFPISNWRRCIGTHRLLGGRPVVPPQRQLGKIGSLSPPQWPPFLGPHTVPVSLLQGASRICTGGFHLPDSSRACSLSISNHGHAVALCLPDNCCTHHLGFLNGCPTTSLHFPNGFSGLSLVLMEGGLGIQNPLPVASIHGYHGHKQPPHGHVHLPLQTEYLGREGASVFPSGCLGWKYGRDAGHLRSF